MTECLSRAFIIDDDPSFRKGLGRLLKANGIESESFDSAERFMNQDLSRCAGCILLDVHLPGLNGLELQERLARAACVMPVVFISGRGDIPTSVRAMKAGAADFLTKPVDEAVLMEAVRKAFALDSQLRGARTQVEEARDRAHALTERELEVTRHVIAGALNKQIGGDLAIAEKTVKVHRGRAMEKLGVSSVAELVRLCALAGIEPADRTKVQ